MNNNRRFILNMMSRALIAAGAAFVPSAFAAVLHGESAASKAIWALIILYIIAGAAGRAAAGSIREAVRPRIWYMTTFFTWLMLCIVTVPAYRFGMPGSSLSDAALSSFAGWTTTGICVYDISLVPASLHLLRASCSWLGGIGIIMVLLTLIPSRQFIGWGLASTEFPGPTFLKSDAPFRTSYKKLLMIYSVLTLAHFVLLMIAGMPLFDSLLTALSNMSTAGLSHINGGIVTGLPGPVKAVIALFSLIGSLSFTVYLLILVKRPSEIRKNSEIKSYAARILITAVIISCLVSAKSVADSDAVSWLRSFAEALMQVISFASTSGYIVTDISAWPVLCVMLVMVQMFIGSCAVSTGGGIKEARADIAFKTLSHTIFRYVHPGSVRTLTLNKKTMKSGQIVRANLFIALFMITWLAGALLLSLDDISVGAALAYSQAVLTNTGTSVAEPLMAGHPAAFSALSKYVMCMLMLAGRLEIYPFIMLFLRSFWKPERAV